jgi:hypothetical protein
VSRPFLLRILLINKHLTAFFLLYAGEGVTNKKSDGLPKRASRLLGKFIDMIEHLNLKLDAYFGPCASFKRSTRWASPATRFHGEAHALRLL